MKKINIIESSVVPLPRSSIDTDQIIPKQFLRSISKLGFGNHLFDEWRFANKGELGMEPKDRPLCQDFILNHPKLQESKILLAGDNFGCGSSREHAVWALLDWGFCAVISSSFADIFATNCEKNGLLLISLQDKELKHLLDLTLNNLNENDEPLTMVCDLGACEVRVPDENLTYTFSINADVRNSLLQGIDDIDRILQHCDKIVEFEKKRKEKEPWLFE